jgi:uncharacterized membrane protein
MSWLIIVFLNVLAISTATLFQRLAMKEEGSDPVTSTIIYQFLLGALVFPFALSQGFVWPPLASMWPYFLFSALLYALGSVLFFKAIKLIEASEMIVLGGAGALVTMLCAYLFLGERLVLWQYLGAGLILAAIMLIATQGKKISFSRGAWFAMLATSLFSIAVVSDVLIIRVYDAISFAAMMSILPGIALLFLFPRSVRALPRAIKTINKNLLLYALLYSVGVVTFYGALGMGAMLSQVSVVVRANIILTVLLAAAFLNERSHLWRKIFAAILCMAGVMLIA